MSQFCWGALALRRIIDMVGNLPFNNSPIYQRLSLKKGRLSKYWSCLSINQANAVLAVGTTAVLVCKFSPVIGLHSQPSTTSNSNEARSKNNHEKTGALDRWSIPAS